MMDLIGHPNFIVSALLCRHEHWRKLSWHYPDVNVTSNAYSESRIVASLLGDINSINTGFMRGIIRSTTGQENVPVESTVYTSSKVYIEGFKWKIPSSACDTRHMEAELEISHFVVFSTDTLTQIRKFHGQFCRCICRGRYFLFYPRCIYRYSGHSGIKTEKSNFCICHLPEGIG